MVLFTFSNMFDTFARIISTLVYSFTAKCQKTFSQMHLAIFLISLAILNVLFQLNLIPMFSAMLSVRNKRALQKEMRQIWRLFSDTEWPG